MLVVGGSLGSKNLINDIIRENLQELLQKINIVHVVVGKGNISEEHKNVKGYVQFEYVKEELPHLMKAASIVVSRAGAKGQLYF